MKRVIILIVLVLLIAASIDCLGFGPGIYGFC
jgi:hypothetical protein